MLRRNVLIFHAGALGDFILAWPLAMGLGRAFAQSRIILITHSSKGQLAEKVLSLDSADIELGWHSLFSDAPALPPRAASLLAGAQAIYTFVSPNDSWLKNVKQHSPDAKLVQLESKPPDDYPGHHSDWLVHQLREHPVERAATEQMLRSISQRGIGASRGGSARILIHPGSGSPAKCWPIESFVQLAGLLKAAGHPVEFVIGEVEIERFLKHSLQQLAEVARVLRPKTYLDLLTELSSAGLFVGNDTGPAHLAGIIGLPTVVLFGPTQPAHWKPLGPAVHTMACPSLADLAVESVYKAAVAAIAAHQ